MSLKETQKLYSNPVGMIASHQSAQILPGYTR
jgi:hypothetical protein